MKVQNRAISPVLSTVILIALTLIAVVAIVGFIFGLFGTFSQTPTGSCFLNGKQIYGNFTSGYTYIVCK